MRMMTRATLALLMGLAVLTAAGQDIKVEKFTLDNGMTVILHEDHSVPIACINTWYRVGALDEPPGRTGFAHLFEHLMFMGTKRVPGNKFDVLMETGGGANNASTDLYRTNYFSWGPSKLLPTLLWLDADRLEDMGLNMTQEKLDKQRDVVRNELRQTVENAPYGKADVIMYQLMYPPDHPYHNEVIGTHEDLEAASVENVRDFFANFYVPNNASLVVAGDFDSAEIKPLVQRLFGTLQRGGDIKRRTPAPPHLDRVVRWSTIDKVQLPKITMAWHSPPAYTGGDAELSLGASVLAQGKTSRLYQRLVVQEKIAAEVSARQQSAAAGSLFTVEVMAKPDADLDRVEKLIDEEIAKLGKDGPTTAELDERRAQIELRLVSSVENLLGRADRLNEYEYFWGEPNSFQRDLERYRKIDGDAVKRWLSETLNPSARAIVRVYPENPQRPDSPRDKQPVELAAKAFTPPPPQTFTLSNGIPVEFWSRRELPLVAVTLLVKPGGAIDTPETAGVGSLAIEMLDEGAGDRDALQFSQAMQSLGATFRAGADTESITISLTTLRRNLDAAAALWTDAIRRPRFDAKDWERVKGLHIDDLEQAREEPNAIAANVGDRLLYGDRNPYAWPVDGTLKTVQPITLEQAKAAYASLVRPDRATLLVAGDLSMDEAKAMLEKSLGDWKAPPGGGVASTPDYSIPTTSGLRLAIVDRPEAVQTTVRFTMPGVKASDPRNVPLRLLNTVLGGSFTSRLNQNLREDKGYTYGARSRYAMEPSTGNFTAGAAVRADATGPSLKEFFVELKRTREGDLSDQESGKAKESMRYSLTQTFEGLRGLVGVATGLAASGQPFETIAQQFAAIDKATTADLNALAKTAIPLEQCVLVLVGDRKLILDQIKDLGLPAPQFYDADGNPVGEGGQTH